MASRIQEWRKQLGRRYRAVIMEEDTLFEAATYRYTLGRLLLGGIAVFLFTVTFTILLVFYTPWIRELIPGYSREDEYEKQQELLSKVAMLEDVLVQRDSFLASLQRMSGDPSGAPSRREAEPAASITPEEESYSQPVTQEAEAIHEHGLDTESDHDGHSHAPAYTGNRENPVRQIRIGNRKIPALPGYLQLVSPVDGVVTSAFNLKEKHFGMDMAAPADALIRAVADGIVIYAEWSDQSGYVLAILHPGGLVSVYKHNRHLFKTTGSSVYSGEAIATIGNTGKNSSGPHLHFELWHEGNPVNPLDYFALN